MDTAAALTAIAGTLVPIAAIGGGVFLVLVGVKLTKWVRRAL